MAYRFPHKDGLATPMFEIWLDGKELPQRYYNLVEDLVYESFESGSDIATIFIKDPEMIIIDDKRLVRGKKVKISGGWKGDMVDWLDGYISIVDIDFPETGDPTVTLHCMDESYILDRVDIKYAYSDTTFSAVAQSIAKRYGMKTSGKSTTKVHESISQAAESDMKLLTRLAESEDLIIKVKNGTIIWRDKFQIGKTQEEFTWRDFPFNMKFFRPRIVPADRKDLFEDSDINLDNKETDSGFADDSTPRDKYGDESTMPGWWERDPVNGIWKKVQ